MSFVLEHNDGDSWVDRVPSNGQYREDEEHDHRQDEPCRTESSEDCVRRLPGQVEKERIHNACSHDDREPGRGTAHKE